MAAAGRTLVLAPSEDAGAPSLADPDCDSLADLAGAPEADEPPPAGGVLAASAQAAIKHARPRHTVGRKERRFTCCSTLLWATK